MYRSSERMRWSAQLVAVLVCGTAIKLFYSAASVNDLIWILAPTKLLVSVVTGVGFTFEPYAGYMSHDHTFIIASACSGVNFLITAFLMLTVVTLWHHRGERITWRFIPVSVVLAYLTTIAANTIRISVALFVRRAHPEPILIDNENLHRAEGILIYFGCLLVLYMVAERFRRDGGSRLVDGKRLFSRVWLPLGVYYAMAIGIPLANAAYRSGELLPDFWPHLFFVFFLPLVLLTFVAIPSFLKRSESPAQFETEEAADHPV